jgi:hypothetical protein
MINKDVIMQSLNCPADQYPEMLHEKFPHVLNKIVQLWNSPDADAYFADLLQPIGRGGGRMDRDGFPDAAWDEILQLKQLHDQTRP